MSDPHRLQRFELAQDEARTYDAAVLELRGGPQSQPLDVVLGPRLLECAQILAELRGLTAREIFGPVDAMKLRSSMTLFALAAPEQPVFRDVLAGYFGGNTDEATEHRLGFDAPAEPGGGRG